MAEKLFRPDRAAETFTPLFRDALTARAIGYPFYQCDLTREQWAAFIHALRDAGIQDREAFAAVLFTSPGYWRIQLGEEIYPYPILISLGWPSVFESAIYSTEGQWALAVSVEEFGLAAGSKEYVASLQNRMPEFSPEAPSAFVAERRTRLDGADAGSLGRGFGWVERVWHDTYGTDLPGGSL
jgi:hypothetical protein